MDPFRRFQLIKVSIGMIAGVSLGVELFFWVAIAVAVWLRLSLLLLTPLAIVLVMVDLLRRFVTQEYDKL